VVGQGYGTGRCREVGVVGGWRGRPMEQRGVDRGRVGWREEVWSREV